MIGIFPGLASFSGEVLEGDWKEGYPYEAVDDGALGQRAERQETGSETVGLRT